ncbi:hypothetical protein CMV_003672 [Castanea mollissima]|uniref:Uncharacterized protein n=1 Tax=Castanea mollissima TaxID=60419 RepID=A0A8J4RGL5_9ROSI|nr:hypothetical protein CMV_003672 [Castanea mollissima]
MVFLSSSVSFSPISSHKNITFASLAQQTHTHNREEPDNGAPSNLNPTRQRHPLASSIPIQPQIHIQSNSAALLPSLCPFVRSFHRLSNLKSQVARNKTNLLLHSRSWIISLGKPHTIRFKLLSGKKKKIKCVVTISSYDAELQIDDFEYLKENSPIGLTEFLEYMARVGEQSVILCRCGYEA